MASREVDEKSLDFKLLTKSLLNSGRVVAKAPQPPLAVGGLRRSEQH
jgi:hypothetical protein